MSLLLTEHKATDHLKEHNIDVRYVVLCSALLSVLGCGVVLISSRVLKDPRVSRAVLVQLHLADGSAALVLCAGVFARTSTVGCVAQAALLQFFYLASALWTSAVAWHLYRVVCHRQAHRETQPQYCRRYGLVCWGLPLSACGVVGVFDAFGSLSDRSWCWITVPLLQTFFYYLPMLVVVIYNTYLYTLLSRRFLSDFPNVSSRVHARLLGYVHAFALCNVWGLVHRMLREAGVDGAALWWLVLLDAFFTPLLGFLHSVLYNANLRKQFQRRQPLAVTAPDSHINPQGASAYGAVKEFA